MRLVLNAFNFWLYPSASRKVQFTIVTRLQSTFNMSSVTEGKATIYTKDEISSDVFYNPGNLLHT